MDMSLNKLASQTLPLYAIRLAHKDLAGVQKGYVMKGSADFIKNQNAETKHSTDQPVSVRKWNRIGNGLMRPGQFNPEETRSSLFLSF
jgi:hypothetical protein